SGSEWAKHRDRNRPSSSSPGERERGFRSSKAWPANKATRCLEPTALCKALFLPRPNEWAPSSSIAIFEEPISPKPSSAATGSIPADSLVRSDFFSSSPAAKAAMQTFNRRRTRRQTTLSIETTRGDHAEEQRGNRVSRHG